MQHKKAIRYNVVNVFGANVDAASLPRCTSTNTITEPRCGISAASTLVNSTLSYLNHNKL